MILVLLAESYNKLKPPTLQRFNLGASWKVEQESRQRRTPTWESDYGTAAKFALELKAIGYPTAPGTSFCPFNITGLKMELVGATFIIRHHTPLAQTSQHTPDGNALTSDGESQHRRYTFT